MIENWKDLNVKWETRQLYLNNSDTRLAELDELANFKSETIFLKI